ncbi:MAG TPA: hypothetical protein VKE71_11605, partial [Candidatus Angelobacter sp.]|nr:hypothetical protein [Candidatus Angelobacter sp.]
MRVISRNSTLGLRLSRVRNLALMAAMLAASGLILAQAPRPDVASPPKLVLHDRWQIQSSCQVSEKGDAVSTSSFQPKNWYAAIVP